jgi:L-threonylcarbamoyladenylate synthase
MTNAFQKDIEESLRIMKEGGVILYPTDTIWGLGCDATNAEAIKRIYNIKKRDDSKSMIILVADERELMQYVAAPDPQVFDFIQEQTRPTTIIFDHAIGLPDNLVAEDGSIAIRMVRDEFCRHLIKRLRHPVVSTSANISGQSSPQSFNDIAPEIKTAVDYIVDWRQKDNKPTQPSRIIKWMGNGEFNVIRE